MRSYREAVYLVLDSVKSFSDDSIWEDEHIVAQLNKYRAILIKQRYLDKKREIPHAFYQRLNIEINSEGNGKIFKSKSKIPNSIDNQILNTYAYLSTDGFNTDKISFVIPQRFKTSGSNKWLKNNVFACIGVNSYLYLKIPTEELGGFEDLILDTILDNPLEANRMSSAPVSDELSLDFPVDEALYQTIIELVIKEISILNGLPVDNLNNANDDNQNVPRAQNTGKQ